MTYSLSSFKKLKKSEKDLYLINIIKGLVIDGVRKANSGHPGGPMSMVDMAYIAYSEFIRLNPKNTDCPKRDRVVFSAGHVSMLQYSLLFFSNILTLEDLKSFRQLKSNTPGHPEVEKPGIDATTGPLGQGIGMGIGMALAESKIKSNTYTFIFAGDGDFQEPVALGSATLAGHWKLNKIIMFYDSNEIQIAGKTSRVDSSNYKKIFEAMHWNVIEIDGHNHDEIRSAIAMSKKSDKPNLIIGKTTMAKGSASLENSSQAHGAPFSFEEIKKTKINLNLPDEEFYCPSFSKEYFLEKRKKLNIKNLKKSQDYLLNDYSEAILSLSKMLIAENSISTRKAFGKILEKMAEKIPTLIGGSADLDESNCTNKFAEQYKDYSSSNRSGRNIAFGVREFPMGTILNGIALYGGFLPFGGTFLTFSDYMRSSIRLAAIQKNQILFEFTHDSIFVGEDGPTHQPVEQLMSLRAIPNLFVFRPANANETIFTIIESLKLKSAPSAIALSRQNLLNNNIDINLTEKGVAKGAYIIQDCKKPDFIIFASGSEVEIAIEINQKLNLKGRVISVPCWELFEKQTKSYKNRILSFDCKKRISIEAGVSLGWERFVGFDGLSIGIDSYGFSAPGEEVAKSLKFDNENILKKIKLYLK